MTLISLKPFEIVHKKHYKKSLSMIPYIFTFANALLGFLSVVQVWQNNLKYAAYCIILAAFMDACDGRLARALGSASYLGAELDVLCDAISFCFAPAILLYDVCNYGWYSIAILGLYLCAGLYRLARFNCINQKCDYFIGLPTTAAAFFLASILIYKDWFMLHSMSWLTNQHCILILASIIACLMISRIPFPSFKTYNMRFAYVYIKLALLLCLLLFCCSRGYPVFFFLLGIYILSAVISAGLVSAKRLIGAIF